MTSESPFAMKNGAEDTVVPSKYFSALNCFFKSMMSVGSFHFGTIFPLPRKKRSKIGLSGSAIEDSRATRLRAVGAARLLIRKFKATAVAAALGVRAPSLHEPGFPRMRTLNCTA